jgi:hypothetical protein
VWEPELLTGAGRSEGPLVVDGDDGVEGVTGIEVLDHPGRAVGVVEGDDDGTIAHAGGQGRELLGAHDHVDTDGSGRGEEIGGPVRRGGQEQKDSRHGLMMAI